VTSKILGWCKRTLFSAKWWKDHWYIPLIFTGFLLVWILRGGRGDSPVVNLSKKIVSIKEKERKKVTKIKEDAKAKEKAIDDDLETETKKVKTETEEKIKKLEKQIENDKERLQDNSEEVNKLFNDVIE
jgi:flagellar motility protein MotE (MotC chaperone)